MKRTPLNRKGSLKRTPLKRTDTLSRGDSTLKRTAFKPKPKVKSQEEISCREVVKTRSEGICEICGINPASDMAHRVGAGQSGKWMPANLLHACRKCHSYNHDHPQNSFKHGWHLQSYRDPLKEPVLLVKNGASNWYLLKNNGQLKRMN